MSQGTWPGDLFVQGNLSAKTMSPPAASVGDATIQSPAAGSGVSASKLMHRFDKHYAQAAGVNVAAEQKVVHVTRGTAGTVNEVVVTVVTPPTGVDTVAVDLRKNGVSILTAPITITNAATTYSLTTQAGFSSNALAAGDVLEVKVTVNHTTGTLPQGLGVQVQIDESPS